MSQCHCKVYNYICIHFKYNLYVFWTWKMYFSYTNYTVFNITSQINQRTFAVKRYIEILRHHIIIGISQVLCDILKFTKNTTDGNPAIVEAW